MFKIEKKNNFIKMISTRQQSQNIAQVFVNKLNLSICRSILKGNFHKLKTSSLDIFIEDYFLIIGGPSAKTGSAVCPTKH